LALQKNKLSRAVTSKVAPRRLRSRTVKRTRRSRDDLLNRIGLAARDEFKRSGFAGATTAAIARNADVTEAQLFRVFSAVLASVMFKDWIFPAGLATDEEITVAVNDFIKEGTRAHFGFGSS
jgi:hypothetical protein